MAEILTIIFLIVFILFLFVALLFVSTFLISESIDQIKEIKEKLNRNKFDIRNKQNNNTYYE